MSVKAMAWVWDQKLSANHKLVLLAYADHAEHDGSSIFPAVESVANKTGYSERTIQRITRDLEENGWLISEGPHPNYGTNRWRIPIPHGWGGDKMTPLPVGGVSSVQEGVTNWQGGGDIYDSNSAQMSPEPSFNPSIKPPEEPSKNASRKRDVRLDHPALIAYREEARLHIPMSWRQAVVDMVDDAERWRRIVHDWIGRGWNKQNVKGMLSAYQNGGISGKKQDIEKYRRTAELLAVHSSKSVHEQEGKR